MKDFIIDNNLEIVSLRHREIYLSDVRRVETDKLKTVLDIKLSQKYNDGFYVVNYRIALMIDDIKV